MSKIKLHCIKFLQNEETTSKVETRREIIDKTDHGRNFTMEPVELMSRVTYPRLYTGDITIFIV